MKRHRFLSAVAVRAYARPRLGRRRTGWLVIVLSLVEGGVGVGPR